MRASATLLTRPRSSPATRTIRAWSPATRKPARSSTRCCSIATGPAARARCTMSRPSARSARSCPTTRPRRRFDLARRGKGSLVASVFTNDPVFAEEVVLGLAPFHGRVMIGNRVSAKTSTGHGSPLPGLVHGGPGRAGGGEELGGIRGVKHYMQRTAVQGAPTLLSAVTGRWIQGAEVRNDGEHPFRKSLAELKIGDQLVTGSRTVTLEDIEHFADFTGDTFYAHMDEEAAQGQSVLRRTRCARLSHRFLCRRSLRRSGPGPGPGQLRRRQSALPDAGQSGRHAAGPAHLQGNQSACRRRVWRGALGLPRDQPERRDRRRSTTS